MSSLFLGFRFPGPRFVWRPDPIKAWHEKLGTSTQTVTIGANETKEINFVFKGM